MTRNHFTMIPNLVTDHLDLDPYEFRLYGHLRRVAGEEGECWRSTRTLATECRMSTFSVSKAKQSLKEKGLIAVRTERGPHGDYHVIGIVDIWERNEAAFIQENSVQEVNAIEEERLPDKPERLQDKRKRLPDKPERLQDKRKRLPDKRKKIPLSRSPEEESPTGSPDGDPRPPPGTFEEWLTLIRESTNRPAALVGMFQTLYPARDPPDYGYIGKVARQVGGAGRLAELLWQHSTRPPTGDVLAYIQASEKRRKHDDKSSATRGKPGPRLGPDGLTPEEREEVTKRQRAALASGIPADAVPP